MIVVGILAPPDDSPASVIGAAQEVALRAAATGARTEIVGVAPAGPVADRQLAQLAASGVGHATVTRSAAHGIEPADLDLALRYLPEVRSVVLVTPPALLLATAIAACAWSGATLVVVGPLEPGVAAALDDATAVDVATAIDVAAGGPGVGDTGAGGPIVLDPPTHDPDGAFAGVVAAFAVRLDSGEDPTIAWRSTLATFAINAR